ncbi:MAG: D-alanyl-D-alanine carboxypeptidase [Roseburia sp.]|nr:D-alanyl-D-alanine carboxypeptidase [Roseburia sp.]
MKKDCIKRWAGCLLCWLFLSVQLITPTLLVRAETGAVDFDQELYATGAVLLDGRSGRMLYGKNAEVPMAMASTTKIMTCILVLENCDLQETLTVSSYASGMPKVKLYLQKGEEYRVEDLLYSLMLESHNDTAVALAEHVGRKRLEQELGEKPVSEYTTEESKKAVAAFAALMNQKAEKLGCKDTYFITPNGLDATETLTLEDGSTVQREHMTTARDLAVIMAYCVGKSGKSQEFLHITRTGSYSFAANGRSFCCNNHNAFLNMMEGALSGKTGFTNKAGYCYVGALEREGRIFIVALLACGWPNNKGYKWSDTKKLMEYGVVHYRWQDLSDETLLYDAGKLPDIPVAEGQTGTLGEHARVAVRIPERETVDKNRETGEETEGEGMLLREDERVQVKCYLTRQLEAPVAAGRKVGKIEYLLGDEVFKTETIVTAASVERIDLVWCIRQIFRCFTGI